MQLRLSTRQSLAVTADQAEKLPMFIPVKIALLFADGASQQHLLHVTQDEQHFVFNNIQCQAVVVWLEHFSAPVKLVTEVSDDDLLFIARHATDGVARWDAMQQFWSNKIAEHLTNRQLPLVLSPELLQLFRQWILQPGDDLALTAELLTLPDFDSLAEQHSQIPVDDLLAVLQTLKRQLADSLSDVLLQCYNQQEVKPYCYTPDQVGVRKLRGLCLSYLALTAKEATTLLQQQYDNADNMTDTIAALNASLYAQNPVFYRLIDDFSQRWQHDVLVMDKCFALIASDPQAEVFIAIERMQHHPLFSWNNPNRVRALLLAFSQRNPTQFHRLDGKGYQLLANSIIKLDPINAQVAARLVTPLLSWQRYDPTRQQLMRQALMTIAAIDGISNDVFEKVNKSLN
jgi:aminopeptidase N